MAPTHRNALAWAFLLTTVACERPTPGVETVIDPGSPASTIDAALVIDCVTGAVQQLGWLGRGAHAGHFIATARDAGLVPATCDPLTDESFTFGYPLAGGGTLNWFVEDIQPLGQDVQRETTPCSRDAGAAYCATQGPSHRSGRRR